MRHHLLGKLTFVLFLAAISLTTIAVLTLLVQSAHASNPGNAHPSVQEEVSQLLALHPHPAALSAHRVDYADARSSVPIAYLWLLRQPAHP